MWNPTEYHSTIEKYENHEITLDFSGQNPQSELMDNYSRML